MCSSPASTDNSLDTDLSHLIYISRAYKLLSNTDLLDILELARIRNEKNNVTGMLLYKDLSFIQVLEGPPKGVEKIFSSINRDPRHTRIRVLKNEPIEFRTFKDWSMGFHNMDKIDLDTLPGFTDYLRDSTCIEKLIENPSAAVKLLTHFRSRS